VGTTHTAAPSQPVSNGMVPVIPGRPLPFWCNGGPVFGAKGKNQ
jgi:hypothetical protein